MIILPVDSILYYIMLYIFIVLIIIIIIIKLICVKKRYTKYRNPQPGLS